MFIPWGAPATGKLVNSARNLANLRSCFNSPVLMADSARYTGVLGYCQLKALTTLRQLYCQLRDMSTLRHLESSTIHPTGVHKQIKTRATRHSHIKAMSTEAATGKT